MKGKGKGKVKGIDDRTLGKVVIGKMYHMALSPRLQSLGLEELELKKEKERKEMEELDENMTNFLLEQRRDWSEIPPNALAIVFQNLMPSQVLLSAGPVCHAWWQLATHPAGPYLRCIDGRCLDMRRLPYSLWSVMDTDKLCKLAFDHTGGLIDKLYLVNVSDDSLAHFANRGINIKLLSLIRSTKVTPHCLHDFLRRCPLLQELRLYACCFDLPRSGYIAEACPDLKRLSIEGSYLSDPEINEEAEYRRFKKRTKYHGYYGAFNSDTSDCDSDSNSDTDSHPDELSSLGDRMAYEVANNMQHLRHLQLLRCKTLTRKGVGAILDKCLHLESLDLRCCFRLHVDKALHTKLSKIKSVRLSRCSRLRQPI